MSSTQSVKWEFSPRFRRGCFGWKSAPAIARIKEAAPADEKLRESWLERLWEAVQNDDIPYIEELAEQWGDLCGSPLVASLWADQFIGTVRMAWSSDPGLRGHFKGTFACLSSLCAAGRNEELLELLQQMPYKNGFTGSGG